MPYLQNSSESETIVGIQLGVFSPEEVTRRSVVEITSPQVTDGKIGGLFDPRMGVLENGKLCRSCGLNNHNCPGHFGHYKLSRPVYYIQFFKTVMKVLRCVCIKCGKLRIDKSRYKNLLRLKGESRWKQVLELCSNIKRCGEDIEDGCGARQPSKYRDEDICRIVAEWKDIELDGANLPTELGTSIKDGVIERYLEPEYVYRILRRISDEDVDFMGFNRFWCRPDWMMCTVLPIPPPQVRPSVLQDNNQRSEDDLTQKLIDIIKTNINLQQKITTNAKKKAIDEWTNVLQYHIATLIDNEIPGIAPSAQRSGRPLKSLQQRLGSKEGRIRNNLQGKRVEYSARSVITPDPNISVAELGVPLKIAMNLTHPERVTSLNIKRMYALIQNGPDRYPGAKTIVRSKDGRIISLKHVSAKDIELFPGDIVNRHIMDGDDVLFNRQPSLHRMSMMGHKAKVLPYNTFRLNVSVTAPYNADFDGDEMNAHIPQSIEAAIELKEIAAVPLQIVGPRESKPIVSVVQDTLVGVNRFTRPEVLFNKRESMNLLIWASRWNGVLPEPVIKTPIPLWSGQQLLSTLLPPVNLEMRNISYDDNQSEEEKKRNYVIIENGIIKQGILDKDVFSKALIHIIYNDFGHEVTVDFLDSLQRMMANFLMNSGFSVGISDLIADSTTKGKIDKELSVLKGQIDDILLQVHTGLFDNSTGRSNQDEFESKVFATLNKVIDRAGKEGRNSLSDNNRMTNMIKAGSKGSNTNVAQMIAVLGQQNIEGKRIPYGFQDRTLPHFKRFDDGAAARGFIESSFVKGLTPHEFFFHAMSGREGLIDTAVKSVTGDTPIIILENGHTKRVCIGDWIDTQLKVRENDVEYFPNEADLELLQLADDSIKIQTCDDNGVISIGTITGITRHDPGDTLYKVITESGRSVIVTAAKSLIVYESATGLFKEKPMSDIYVGDFLPVISDNESKFVIKDIITSITPIDVRQGTAGRVKYPKMYDITVPSTLNFALENGLVVRDTADTGYMQRQLVKAMEDLTIQHDASVRDAVGNIVQFKYGEDGINCTKIESQPLNLAALSDEQIRDEYTIADIPADLLESYLNQIKMDRKLLVERIFQRKLEKADKQSVYYPVHLGRLTSTLGRQMRLTSSKTNISPADYILNAQKIIIDKTDSKNSMWAALIRYHLAPHKLKKMGYSKEGIDILSEQIVLKYWKAMANPGEMVGIIAAQSIGEPSTQMTLNTFHLAGVAAKSNMTRGVPRLKELLKATRNPKAQGLTIYLRRDLRSSKEEARRVAQELEFTVLQDLVTVARIYYDPRDDSTLIEDDSDWLPFFSAYEQIQNAGQEPLKLQAPADATDTAMATQTESAQINRSPWILRLELDREKMFSKNITMDDIAFVLNQKFETDVSVVYSDYNATRLVFRLRLKAEDSDPLNSLNQLKTIQNKILMGTIVRGTPGLRAVSFSKTSDQYELVGNKYEAIEQFVLDTDGSNYLDTICHPDVDPSRCYSNNVHDIFDNLGIEATRAVLFKEISILFEETYVNYRHLCLLCDVMASRGRLMSIDRYGINKNNIGPLAKASFEQTEDIMLRAALYGELDPVTGVSANIMTGQPIRGGTSFSSILLDEEALIKYTSEAPQDERFTTKYERALEEEEDDYQGSNTLEPASILPQISAQRKLETIHEGDYELVDE